MGEYLELIGLENDRAVSAEQAHNRLECFRYDVVVSDFKMPGQSGLDLFRYVSAMYLGTLFVLITGCNDLWIKRECKRIGVHAYIQKPFYLSELRQTIIKLVRREDQKKVSAT